jgi:hypothetical protein
MNKMLLILLHRLKELILQSVQQSKILIYHPTLSYFVTLLRNQASQQSKKVSKVTYLIKKITDSVLNYQNHIINNPKNTNKHDTQAMFIL